MKLTHIIPLILSFNFAFAGDADFSSDSASYRDNKISLKGHVLVNHKIGELSAESAEIEKKDKESSSAFLHMFFENNVQFALPSNAKITCEKAHIDFLSLLATMVGGQRQVTFTDPVNKFCFSANTLSCHFEEEEQLNIDSLRANNNVEFVFDNRISISADQATIHDLNNINGSMPLVEFYPNDDNHPCTVAYDSNHYFASTIFLDPSKETLLLKNMSGSFNLPLSSSGKSTALFSADNLTLDLTHNFASFENHVVFSEETFGTLFVENSLEIQTNGDNSLCSLVAEGPTQLQNGDEILLSCDGVVRFDSESGKFTATSNNTPLCFENGELAIFAKEAVFTYKNKKPEMLSFTNEVTLKNDNLIISADKVTYFLADGELKFVADVGHSVHFYNKDQTLEMTADGIEIVHDPKSRKPIIRGLGKTHFVFKTEDTNPLQELDKCIKNLF